MNFLLFISCLISHYQHFVLFFKHNLEDIIFLNRAHVCLVCVINLCHLKKSYRFLPIISLVPIISFAYVQFGALNCVINLHFSQKSERNLYNWLRKIRSLIINTTNDNFVVLEPKFLIKWRPKGFIWIFRDYIFAKLIKIGKTLQFGAIEINFKSWYYTKNHIPNSIIGTKSNYAFGLL